MSFDQLQQAIFSEAKQQIDKINSRYEKELTSEEERIKTRAKKVEEEIISRIEKEGQMEAQRLHQSAQLEARSDILATKQSELAIVLHNASAEIINWNTEQTELLISSLFELLPETKGVIIAGSAHEEVVRNLAKAKGLKVNKRVIANDGGFIFKGERLELDATISHLLKQLFESDRSTIAKTLFS